MATKIVPLIINGQDVADEESTVFVPNPGGHVSEGKAQGASIEHCKRALESSANAFPSWRRTKRRERMQLFYKLAQLLDDRRTQLRSVIQEELQCPEAVAEGNIEDCIELAEHLACLIGSGSKSGTVPEVRRQDAHAVVFQQPLGVVLGVAPWNAPAFLGLRAVAAPVAAGNCAILKGSEFSPRTHYFIADLFRLAGFPSGVVNFLIHRPEDAIPTFETLISHPAVRKCNFTGSTAVGRQIASRGAHYLKPVLLELGGKNFALVLDDADLDAAADMILVGALLNCGQICMSTDIVLVSAKNKPQLCEYLRRKFKAASSSYVRKVINQKSRDRITTLIEDASAKGAILTESEPSRGEPLERVIMIENLTEDMEFWRQESFGPLLGIATYETVDGAVATINNCEYGLSAAIFTGSGIASVNLASQLDVGAVHVNAPTVHDEAALPHGGRKNSGWGRFGGRWGLDEFLQTQTIIINS
ncbi:Fc.00g059760.m01.CDS01 [Cosmosporella sp. VM-42]